MQPMRLYTHRHMPVNAQAKEVLIRLGMYREQDEKSLQSAREALVGLLPGGCMRLVPVEFLETGIVLGGHGISSRALANYINGCEMALVMLSTLYAQITEKIEAAFAIHKADEAVLLDAAASVAADAGLDYLMSDAARMLRPFGLTVMERRFSPGYADCSIEYQKTLLEILHDQPLGVTLTDSCMLQPEKSVMAIGGVRHG